MGHDPKLDTHPGLWPERAETEREKSERRIAELEAAALDAAEQLERGVFSRDAIALRLRTALGADRN